MSVFQNGDIVKIGNVHCQIVEALGNGTQGDVYAGYYCEKKTACAIKHLYGNFANDPEKFYKKTSILAKGKAPSPVFVWPEHVSTYDGKNQSFLYTMPLLGSGWKPITRVINNQDKLSFEEKLKLAIMYSQALTTLHDHDWVYCDISADNLRYKRENGILKICIIDVENVIPEGYSLGMQGTGLFRAPELIRNEGSPTKQTDVHSFCVLLFYLFLNCHPLDGALTWSEPYSEDSVRKYFGEEPTFIFDSSLKNRPLDLQVIPKMAALPDNLKKIFINCFSQNCLMKKKPRMSIADITKLLETI